MDKRFSKFLVSIPGSFRYWLLCGFLTLVFVTGGSSRGDIQSLAILLPVSVVVCGIALTTIRLGHLASYKWLTAGFIALFCLLALHLVPLPPGIWQALGGRDELAEIDRAAALGEVWRPLTPNVINGWDSVIGLTVPLAVLLLAVQLDRNHIFGLLPVLIGLGALSGFFGLLQAVGNPGGPFYLYSITNQDSAVGLFANRNHAAVLLACLFPMLAVFASSTSQANDRNNKRLLASALLAAVLVPLILVTGSRLGLLAALLGIVIAAILYRQPKPQAALGGNVFATAGIARIAAVAAVLCLVALTVVFSRAEAIDRLFRNSFGDDSRSLFWRESVGMFERAFPLGFGSASFADVYRISEPTMLLNETYLNRAHNDWAEFAVSFGIPGLVLLTIAVFVYVRVSLRLWLTANDKSRSTIYGRMASGLIGMLGIASLTDYPLRTPIMMSVMTIVLLWFFTGNNKSDKAARPHVSDR